MSHKITFEMLPAPIIGHILDQLNQVTGSKGIVNMADLPVIMRYASNLACTSKKIAAMVSSLTATRTFLKSLSDKYGESREELAALLNTVGTRKWLWNYIKENGDSKTYQVIQDIYDVAFDLVTEAKQAGLEFDCSDERQACPSPNPYYYQTQQGFVLYNEYSTPERIATPLGEISIYNLFEGNDSLSVTEVFIRRLNAVFETFVCEQYPLEMQDEETIYEIEASSDTFREVSKEGMKKITAEELKSKKGTQNLIVCFRGDSSIAYKIRNVKKNELPDVIDYKAGKFMRSYTLITRIWEMLEAHRLGKDPIQKKMELKEIAVQSEDVRKHLFNNISEVVPWAIELVDRLQQQPLFPEENFTNGQTKLLVFNHYRDARAIEILNGASKKFLDKGTEWRIDSFGYNFRRSLNGKNLGFGIELLIQEKHTPCNIKTLKTAYDLVIKSVSQNWVQSELKDFPTISKKESEEDYILLTKKENVMCKGDGLIMYLADLLGLSHSITCGNEWDDDYSSGVYLWIRKDSLEKTLKVLNINLV